MLNKITLIVFPLVASAIEFPFEFHGGGFLGKYLNSDTIRYNMDASVRIRSTIIRHYNLSFYINYRDDLDMAEQKGGVSLDPRYAHYYFTAGFEYIIQRYFFQIAFIHDCIHDIDYEVEGTPVFNRLSFVFAPAAYHPAEIIRSRKKFLWATGFKLYPHLKYHGWDINAGADYQCELNLDLVYRFFESKNFGALLNPNFLVCKGDATHYHQHSVRTAIFFQNVDRRIGVDLKYHLYNNDPIKNPGGLWLSSIFLEF